MQQENKCFLCGENGSREPLENHHIFYGTSNRKKSEKHGLKVKLCGFKCHRLGPSAVHNNRTIDLAVKAAGQKKFEETHTRAEFIKEFGKSYL